ncbi:hypothetical protein GCM10010211_71730 [Streptomyces albospinus]|uniref:Uncharacterized protein n=1 Tax=Streptomyces albospinus TaxID=285515 RepID=A0ABQ2VME0_9ACTN|nr:hypothetical protein GCM10010211_71730 [Streptomyces albospinus]
MTPLGVEEMLPRSGDASLAGLELRARVKEGIEETDDVHPGRNHHGAAIPAACPVPGVRCPTGSALGTRRNDHRPGDSGTAEQRDMKLCRIGRPMSRQVGCC